MALTLERYGAQLGRWPADGRHVLAQFDDDTVVVYQAYRPSIAAHAVEHQAFGGSDFSFSRMSWIKPGFLWMMYRCGWATKTDQEHVLAIWLRRDAFDRYLAEAVQSSWDRKAYPTREVWQDEVSRSNVRLQWDPDHAPGGDKQERRAIQIGLRGPSLEGFRGDAIARIEDISELVREQRVHQQDGPPYAALETPLERVYPVTDAEVRARLRLADAPPETP